MAKFIRKPTVVEASQFFPDQKPWPPGVTVSYCDCRTPKPCPVHPNPIAAYVVTIHGQRTPVCPGDWILPEQDGVHFYPCKDNVFRSTYTSVGAGWTGFDGSIVRDCQKCGCELSPVRAFYCDGTNGTVLSRSDSHCEHDVPLVDPKITAGPKTEHIELRCMCGYTTHVKTKDSAP